MKAAAVLLQPYRICGRTVYVYKRPRGGLYGLGWGFWLAGREPVEGFRTRKAALEHGPQGLGGLARAPARKWWTARARGAQPPRAFANWPGAAA